MKYHYILEIKYIADYNIGIQVINESGNAPDTNSILENALEDYRELQGATIKSISLDLYPI